MWTRPVWLTCHHKTTIIANPIQSQDSASPISNKSIELPTSRGEKKPHGLCKPLRMEEDEEERRRWRGRGRGRRCSPHREHKLKMEKLKNRRRQGVKMLNSVPCGWYYIAIYWVSTLHTKQGFPHKSWRSAALLERPQSQTTYTGYAEYHGCTLNVQAVRGL